MNQESVGVIARDGFSKLLQANTSCAQLTEDEYTCDRGIANETAIPYRSAGPERSHRSKARTA
jgi:hypothetical protein